MTSKPYARLGFLLLVCCLLLSGQEGRFTIDGYLVDGLTNKSLRDRKIFLFEDPNGGDIGRNGPYRLSVTSDADGHFTFTDLPSGLYNLQAEMPDQIYTYTGPDDWVYRHRIALGPETAKARVVFRITPSATLQGVVRDEKGDALPTGGVDLYRLSRRNGLIQLQFISSTGSYLLSRYTVGDLLPGDYVICAEPPTYQPQSFAPLDASEARYRSGGQSRVYMEQCYPQATNKGTAIHLSSGARRTFDVVLPSTDSVAVQSKSSFSIYRANLPRMAEVGNAQRDPLSEQWQLKNVPPGEYIVYNGFSERKPITVGSSPMFVDLQSQTKGAIDIHLRGSDGKPMERNAATVSLFALADMTLTDRYMDKGWNYSFDPGEYRLSIRPKAPYCVSSTSLTGGTLANGRVTVSPGMSARLDVELGNNCGSVDIHAETGGSDAPFTEYALLLAGTPQAPGDILTGVTDAHGRSSIAQLPPGRYSLWAWQPDADGYLGPDITSSSARHVEVVVTIGQATAASVSPDRSPTSR